MMARLPTPTPPLFFTNKILSTQCFKRSNILPQRSVIETKKYFDLVSNALIKAAISNV